MHEHKTVSNHPETTVAPAAGKSHVVREEWVHRGKWLGLKHIHWADATGKERVWECLERSNHAKAEVDAVEIIPILKAKGKPNRIILVRQFRPPVHREMLELPAGLCDSKETPEESALRELKEETGYQGKVVDRSFPIWFGMAISNTSCAFVHVEIDEDLPENRNPTQHLDEGEFTSVVVVPVDNLRETLTEYQKKNEFGIDGKIWIIAYILEAAGKMTS